MKKKLGLAGAALWGAGLLVLVQATHFSRSVDQGIGVGAVIAYFQAIVSLAAMRWAFDGKRFFWVWAVSFFFRLTVFGLTAYVVFAHSTLNLPATMLTLVGTTTVIMVLESWAYFNKGQ